MIVEKKFILLHLKKKKNGGIEILNKILQDIYNDDALELISTPYASWRVNDKIIRTENDYSDGRMRVNGDTATLIEDPRTNPGQVCIQYNDDGEKEILSFRDFWDNFDHFYASSIHKMQGSQTDIIVVVMPKAHNFMWTLTPNSKKLLYTAISRCKEKCIIIGSPELFIKAQNPRLDNQISLFMKEFIGYNIE